MDSVGYSFNVQAGVYIKQNNVLGEKIKKREGSSGIYCAFQSPHPQHF